MNAGDTGDDQAAELERLRRQYLQCRIWRGRTTGDYWAMPTRDHPTAHELIGVSAGLLWIAALPPITGSPAPPKVAASTATQANAAVQIQLICPKLDENWIESVLTGPGRPTRARRPALFHRTGIVGFTEVTWCAVTPNGATRHGDHGAAYARVPGFTGGNAVVRPVRVAGLGGSLRAASTSLTALKAALEGAAAAGAETQLIWVRDLGLLSI